MTATVQQKKKENKKETREKNGYYFSKEKKKTRSHLCVCHVPSLALLNHDVNKLKK